MPRNASGVYVQPASDVNPPIALTTIDPVAYANAITDIANEITNSLDRLGRAPMQAILAMGAFRITGLGAPIGQNDAARLADLGLYLPPGAIQLFGMNVAPLGWLVCDGTSYATATYPALFANVGYVHGGSGANFNVPDMRGVMPRGWDNGRGLDPARVFASYQADMFASHTHVQNAHNHATTESPHSHTYQAGGGSTAATGGGVIAGDLPGQTTTAVATGLTINNATAVNQNTGSTETTAKNLALLFCIRT